MDVVDVQQNKLVWEGALGGRITDQTLRNLEAEIDDAVRLIFDKFPVAPAELQPSD